MEERGLSLSDILRSPSRGCDRSENARRELLSRFVRLQVPAFTATPITRDVFRSLLMDAVVKLQPLSEQSGLLKFLRNELLNGFVHDVAHAKGEEGDGEGRGRSRSCLRLTMR